MGFAGFNPGIQGASNSWELPVEVVTELNLKIVHDLDGIHPRQLTMDDSGMFYWINVANPDSEQLSNERILTVVFPHIWLETPGFQWP